MPDDTLIHDPRGGLPRLIAIMARLRDPDTGCPWDVEQDFASIAPYTIEEAYEVADAIDRKIGRIYVVNWGIFSCRWCFMPKLRRIVACLT